MNIFSVFLIALLGFVSGSCQQEVDFDQVEEFQLENALVFNLVYFTVTPADFNIDGSGTVTPFTSEKAAIAEFQEAFIQNNLTEATLTFGITTSLDNAVSCDIIFSDAAGDVTYILNLEADASDAGTEIFREQQVVIAGETLSRFKDSRFLEVVVRVADNTVPTTGELQFKSKGRFELVY